MTDPFARAWLRLEDTRQVKSANKITPRILSLNASERNDDLATMIEIVRTKPIAMGLEPTYSPLEAGQQPGQVRTVNH
jgi:hypothetical protein